MTTSSTYATDIAADEDIYLFPMSLAQQRLWFLHELEPQSPAYNLTANIRLNLALNVPLLQASLNTLLERHEVLRTSFMVVDDQPRQLITPSLTLPLPLVDLSALSGRHQQEETLRLANQEAQQPFDLGQAPLVRARLLKLAEQDNLLLLTFHHIISDGWSINVFFQELAALYDAITHGRPSPLPPLPLQYVDFAIWQQEHIKRDGLSEQLAYWKQQLAGAPTTLDLPTDHPRPASPSSRGSFYMMTLPSELVDALKTLSRQQGTTLYMTLVAAFQCLLSRYSSQEDLVLGTVASGRTQAELEPLIGFFVNTLVLRTDLSGNPTFSELLGHVREVVLQAHDHQDVPFDYLVKELQPDRTLGQNPLFQALLSLDLPMSPLPAGWPPNPIVGWTGTSKFDLSLELNDEPHGMICRFEYSTELFDEATIVRMAGHWQTLLGGVVADPAQRLADLPLLTEAERHQLLVEWNATHAEYPVDRCIHQLFEAQVERTPNAVAVSFEGQHMTYRELNSKANQLARYLQQLRVGPEMLVGLCVERSPAMIVGLLGILKAGGVYVPLDPEYPQERLSFLLQDTQMPVLLTQQRLISRLPQQYAQLVCLDSDWDKIAQQSEATPISEVTGENLAYVIYTSGSTGQPKGGLIPHRALAAHCWSMAQVYEMRAEDCVLQFSTFTFDASLEQILTTLLVGARLLLRGQDVWLPAQLLKQIQEGRLTVINLPPAYLHQVLQEWAQAPQSLLGHHLRLVIVGGDRLLPETLHLWRQTPLRSVRLLNAYGPTETIITATLYDAAGYMGGNTSSESVPIGRPLPDRRVYLLDRAGALVPIGVPGELHIGGELLARGYLNHPALTAERFIADPFSNDPQARLYKTGDLVRYLANGTIEFLGRVDQQVKIRGFRIELGEIEAVLSQYPEVREAVVVAREDSPGDKRLVAYVVLHQGQTPTISDLRDHVMKTLPSYMVPSAFVPLEVLPMTSSGKVDRRALPAPQANRLEVAETFVAPRAAIEEVLADIWAQVLRLDRLGVHDNFFELGGDSILGLQMIARAHQAGLSLTTKHLFQYQTIAQLAVVVTLSQSVEAQQAPVTGAVPLTPIQHWFFEQRFVAPHHWNQAWLLEMNQALDGGLLEQAVQQVLTHHDALRLRFTPEGSGWLQWHEESERAAVFRHVDLSRLSAAEQQVALEAIAAEAQASLHLEAGPLVRVVYFQMGLNQPARLLIVIHHLVVDGVSWRILLEDLTTAYQQLRKGHMPHLPTKTTSFQQWAQRLTEYAQSAAVRQELLYWLNIARRHPLPLPVDFTDDRRANTMASAGTVGVSLSAEETEALLHSVPKVYHTQINDVLLTALVQAFARWTGERTLLVDLEGHGREALYEDVNLSRTVGWFTTIFPVCLELNDISPGEALKAIKEQLRHIPNHGIGYGMLRYMGEQVDRERLKALPQAQVSFNYLGQFDQVVSERALFKLARESAGPTCNLHETRSYLLEIDGLVIDGHLEVSWLYNEHVHQRATIERLANYYLEALRSLMAHCQSPEAGGYMPYFALLAARLVNHIKHVFGKRIALSTLFSGPTLAQLAEALQQQEHADARTSVLPVQVGGSKRPFFFLHGDWTGCAFYCFALARALGPDQPFYVLEPYKFAGLQSLPALETVAAVHLETVRAIQPEGPYLLGGFCSGGLLAYELARQLRAAGERVDFLALIESSSPVQYEALRAISKRMSKLPRLGVDTQAKLFLRLRHAIRHVYRTLRPSGRRVQDFDKLLAIDPRLERMFPPVEALYNDYIGVVSWAVLRYETGVYPGKITFYWAREEPSGEKTWVPVTEAKDGEDIEIHIVPGTHMSCVTEHIQDLAASLSTCLSRIQEEALNQQVGVTSKNALVKTYIK